MVLGGCEMTREEAKNSIDEIDFLTWQIDIIEDMLDQIFNDHEAQLKAEQRTHSNFKELVWDCKQQKEIK